MLDVKSFNRGYSMLFTGAQMQSVAPFIDIRCTIFMNKIKISSVILLINALILDLTKLPKLALAATKTIQCDIGNKEKM